MSLSNDRPLVTVILSCYNHEEYVGEAIDSIMNQTYSNFELLITDDGSTDDSRNVIRDRVKKYNNDSRIICFLKEENTTFSVVEEASLKASGKYFTALGGDDMFFPEKLEKQVMFMEENQDEYAACFTWVECLGNDEKKMSFFSSKFNITDISPKELMMKMIIEGNCLNATSVMMTTSIFRELHGLNFGFRQLQDYQLWIKCLLNHNIYIIPEKLVYYRVVGGSLSDASKDAGVAIRTLFEQEEILYEIMSNMDLNSTNSVLDPVVKDETELDTKCAKIKFLLDNKNNTIFVSVALRLYYQYVGEEGFASLLAEKYGIARRTIYSVIAENSIYSICVNHTNRLKLFMIANEMRRIAIDHLDKSDITLVEELLDFIDAGAGKVTLDHLVALYNYCYTNDRNADDFVEVIKGLKARGVELFD